MRAPNDNHQILMELVLLSASAWSGLATVKWLLKGPFTSPQISLKHQCSLPFFQRGRGVLCCFLVGSLWDVKPETSFSRSAKLIHKPLDNSPLLGYTTGNEVKERKRKSPFF